jgi:hypothetical protein
MGPGESAAHVTEQLVLHQCFRDGAAVHGDEGVGRPGTGVVDSPGHQFLAGSALALHQNGDVVVGGNRDQIENTANCQAGTDNDVCRAPEESGACLMIGAC